MANVIDPTNEGLWWILLFAGGAAQLATSPAPAWFMGGSQVQGLNPGTAAYCRVIGDPGETGINPTNAGTALVKGYSGGRYPHFSVQVQYGSETLETDQVTWGDYQYSGIREVTRPRSPTDSKIILLPNAKAALEYQRSIQGTPLGPYGLNNSCVTHVCDVLRAGGASGVPYPNRGGIRDVTYIKNGLGFSDLFKP